MGDASFVYWIFVFLFYFLPGYCVVNTVVWPPILIAGIFLGAVWLTKVYKDYKERQIKHQIRSDDSKEESKRRAEGFLVQAVKHQIKIEALLNQKTEEGIVRYAKVKFREQITANSKCRESRLCKEIKEVLRRRSDFIGVRAIFNGFVLGCFTIYFSFWLLGSALALFVSCNPLIFPLVSLSLGLSYGIYSAIKYCKRDLKVLSQVENSFAELKKIYANVEIPDISLRACDRLFRRRIIHPSGWTRMKQLSKRFWIGFIKFGTGVLFLKLLPLGTTTVIMAAVGLPVTCSFFPMLGVMLAGGLFFAAWHVWQYHCESKEAQAGRVMDFLLNAPASLQDNPVCSEIVESNSLSYSGKCSVSTNVLNRNELAFSSLFNGSNRFLKLRRQSSNSEPCLNKQQEFNTISSSQAQFCHANNGAAVNQDIEQIPFRKRSSTLPPDIRTKRQAIDFQTPKIPNYCALFKNCRDCRGSERSLVGSLDITLSQNSLITSC